MLPVIVVDPFDVMGAEDDDDAVAGAEEDTGAAGVVVAVDPPDPSTSPPLAKAAGKLAGFAGGGVKFLPLFGGP